MNLEEYEEDFVPGENIHEKEDHEDQMFFDDITGVQLDTQEVLHSREQTCLRLPFQVSTNMSTLYRRFPGECIATFFLHIDPETANMSQFLQLGPLDFDPDLGYVSYFRGIDSANNHSHISKPHPLNNTDTLGGRFPWLVIQPLTKCNWFLECTPTPIFLPTHEHHL